MTKLTADTLIRECLEIVRKKPYPISFKIKIEKYIDPERNPDIHIEIGDKIILIQATDYIFKETYNLCYEYEYIKERTIIKCKTHNPENQCTVKYRTNFDPKNTDEHIYYSTLSTLGELKTLYNRISKRYKDTRRFIEISKRELWLRIFSMEKRIKQLENNTNNNKKK